MTERERWQSSEDPDVLGWFGNWETPRKHGLLVAACCRRIWPLLRDDRLRDAVELVERHLDGQATDEDSRRMVAAVSEIEAKAEGRAMSACAAEAGRLGLVGGWRRVAFECADEAKATATAVKFALCYENNELPSVFRACALAVAHARVPRCFPEADVPPEGGLAYDAERRAQAALVRDVFRPPFLRREGHASWGTSAVRNLAAGMYAGREFSAMPALADALEAAGCDCGEVLAHCRGSGPHVRGCWVVDLLLGMS